MSNLQRRSVKLGSDAAEFVREDGSSTRRVKQSTRRLTTLQLATIVLGGFLCIAGLFAFFLPSMRTTSKPGAPRTDFASYLIPGARRCSKERPDLCTQRQLHQLFTENEEVVKIGNTTYLPSFGIFPRGCKWREVHTQVNDTKKVSYQFWQSSDRAWVDEMPESCTVTGHPAPGPPGDWEWHKGSPRSDVVPYKSFVMYHNLWYNNGRWYALVDGPNHLPSWKFSRNQEIITLHVQNATDFINSVKWRVVPGDTLLFDFIYFIHPTAIGHWWEMLGPLYSTLKTIDFKRPCDQFVLLHLKRQHVMEWVRAMLAVTLGVGLDEELPPIMMQTETENVWKQITQRLEGFESDEWVSFERMLIVRDLFTGGTRTFLSSEDAREFRSRIYQQYALPPPAPRPHVPRVITFQRKRANRRVINEPELLDLLKQYGELRVVEFNGSNSLAEQLNTMRETGVYMSVHTSNLANSPFLMPGSAVVELIQRHWSWNGLDTSFRDQTALMGDIHHYAWRAKWPNETVYLGHRDLEKFGTWNNLECFTEECVESSTNVDVIVDVAAVKRLLDDRLPLVFRGASVAEALLPWPDAIDYPVEPGSPPLPPTLQAPKAA